MKREIETYAKQKTNDNEVSKGCAYKLKENKKYFMTIPRGLGLLNGNEDFASTTDYVVSTTYQTRKAQEMILNFYGKILENQMMEEYCERKYGN